MKEFINSQEAMKTLRGKVLGGSKVPHSCSFPVLRMMDGTLYLAYFVQLQNREQMQKNLIQRPAYWYIADLKNGELSAEFNCKTNDFATAPFDKLYIRGEAARKGTSEDVSRLYDMLDDIRSRYLKDGFVDVFAYRDYLKLLFEVIPKGQINFYKELSKLK